MDYHFRKAKTSDIPQIWGILQQAIERRKEEGSNQWQDGYPNLETLQIDIEKGEGYILTGEKVVIGYCAILVNDEPDYEKIKGKWLTNNDFVVFHRLAISEKYLGKGFSKILVRNIEEIAISNKIYSIKADTNYDNITMMKIFENMGYTFCGEILFRGSPRKAYEKVLAKTFKMP